MMMILFQRVMQLENEIILYIVPKFINTNSPNVLTNIRSHFKNEQNSLATDVHMLKPILVGEYELSRSKIHKLCKEDSLIKQFLDTDLFFHFTNKFNDLNTIQINNFSNDIKKRLQFVLTKYENNLLLDFKEIVDQNFVEYKSFYKVKSIKRVNFDLK